MGVKNAAVRKLEHELGIRQGVVPADQFRFVTRILYRADSASADAAADGGSKWEEWELDHVLFVNAEVTCEPVANEVAAVRYITKDNLLREIAEKPETFTPWFKLICRDILPRLWDEWSEACAAGDGGANLKTLNDDKIHDFINV
jgi:isopentenyl-diphosphate delta-isomerase